MGQPKFARKKFETPNHPWQGDRIKEEHELRRKFGLKNKSEIWKAQSRLRSIRGQARELISRTRNPDDIQAKTEAERLTRRLHREGYVGKDAGLNEVLGLDIERILNRRLQSQVYLKGMARTPNQARQFVAHGLVRIGDRRVTVPSYVVRRDEEELIVFEPTAAVADENHPVRPRAPGVEARETIEEAPAAEEKAAEPKVEEARKAGADAEAPAKEPTGQGAPAGKEQEGTVAPSEGEPAEDAARETAPGEAAPAEEAKKPTEEAEPAPEKATVEAPEETPAEAPVEPEKGEEKPAEAEKPTEAEEKAEPEKAEEKPAEPEEPAQPAEEKAEKPAEPEKPTEPKAEEKPTEPKAEEKPAEPEAKPTEPEKPTEPKAEEKADKPTEPKADKKAAEADKSAEAKVEEKTEAEKPDASKPEAGGEEE